MSAMNSDSPSEAARRYLDLMELVLTGVLIQDPPIVTDSFREFHRSVTRLAFPDAEPSEAEIARYAEDRREAGLDHPSLALTMIGRTRLRNFRGLIEAVLREGVAGDIIETGVWRGVASILARAVLLAWGDKVRRILVADSFEGLPPPGPDYPADAGSRLHEERHLAVSLETVRRNFEVFDLHDDQVVFLKGWFRDTMPTVPSDRLAVIRLDGDMYESTIDPLNHLYDKLSPGGFVIVDDYWVPACRAAVEDFLSDRKLTPTLTPIDGMAIYFQK